MSIMYYKWTQYALACLRLGYLQIYTKKDRKNRPSNAVGCLHKSILPNFIPAFFGKTGSGIMQREKNTAENECMH